MHTEQQWKEEPKKFNVIVKAKSKQTPEYIKTVIKTKVNPIKMKVGISTFKALRNGDMLIQAGNKTDMEVICNTINEKCGNELDARSSKLRNPRLIVFNVPGEMDLTNLKNAIIEQNSEINLQEGDFEPKFVFKDKRKDSNLVMEVNPETRKKLLGQKIKIGWHMCYNDDYIKINRCFKCNKYNHRASDCTGELSCPFCAGNHSMRECRATREQYRCTNCFKFNTFNTKMPVNENHSALDKNCSAYKIMMKKYIANTNY